MLSSNFI